MRTQNLKFLLAALLLLPLGLKAQEDKPQGFWIHEDVVKPGMVKEYESTCKELIANMQKHNIQEVNMIAVNLIDDRYLFVGPIENMAQLDKPAFATLAEKMGGESMGVLFKKMDKCYDTEHDYVIYLEPSLSYMPSGITQSPSGQDYRKFHYYHYTPGDRASIRKKVEAIRNLYEKKGSKLEYRVYRSGFGTRGEFYMVAIAAKDPVDYANKIAANNEMMGEEWLNAYDGLLSSLLKYETFEGQMRPDMAYSPKK